MEKPVEAELVGSRIIVWDVPAGNRVYRMGFFGKPVGIPKPKPSQEFDVPLMLDIIEGLYLLDKRLIKIISPTTGRAVTRPMLLKLARKMYLGFDEAYFTYKDLRERGYVVTPGIKFGADFAVYEHGPGIDHAPFIVSVRGKKETLSTFDVVRAGRLATTVRKQFIIAMRNKAKDISYLMFQWFKA